AVPTPFKDNHEPDLSYIRAAVEALAPVLKKRDLVILESTHQTFLHCPKIQLNDPFSQNTSQNILLNYSI
ncbi:hypothetical protein, partial [uncultured Acetobacterium sp.]|uniref:hypothetical protein n=1 Tax=uncultured Acetobacterium sp. TaxID=217139 RepID=UPI00344B7BBF